MRNCFRLHLLNLLGLRPSPLVLPSPLSCPVEPMSPPSKINYIIVFSETTYTFHFGCFLERISALTSKCSLLLLTSFTKVLSPIFTTILYFIIYFWWRWGELNSRPEHLRLEGITTIHLLYI